MGCGTAHAGAGQGSSKPCSGRFEVVDPDTPGTLAAAPGIRYVWRDNRNSLSTDKGRALAARFSFRRNVKIQSPRAAGE